MIKIAHERCSGPRSGGRFASRRARSGFSFIEVLLAALVVGTVLVAATSSITGSVKAKHIMVGESGLALGLAREIQVRDAFGRAAALARSSRETHGVVFDTATGKLTVP
jgi:type II secretory pathway pseudopilin PulG